MRQTLAHFLQRQGGFTIWEMVLSAEAALDQLTQRVESEPESESLPDLVLIDVSLPGMSGIDLLTILYKKYPDLPCLMLSGHERNHYVQQSLNNGARGYVAKGDPPRMLEAIRRVLSGQTFWGTVC